MPKAKKKRKQPEFVLTKEQYDSIVRAATSLVTDVVDPGDKVAMAEAPRLSHAMRIYVRGARAIAIRLLGRAVLEIANGADASQVFGQPATTKPVTRRPSSMLKAAWFYYKARAIMGPAASDQPLLDMIRAKIPSLKDLKPNSLLRVLREYRERAMSALKEQAERDDRLIAIGVIPQDRGPSLKQLAILESHLQKKSRAQ